MWCWPATASGMCCPTTRWALGLTLPPQSRLRHSRCEFRALPVVHHHRRMQLLEGTSCVVLAGDGRWDASHAVELQPTRNADSCVRPQPSQMWADACQGVRWDPVCLGLHPNVVSQPPVAAAAQ